MNPDTKNRLFISMPVTLENYEMIQKTFDSNIEGKWMPADQLHLTLLFLGERYSEKEVIERLKKFTCKLEPMPLTRLSLLNGRILYADVKGDMNAIYSSLIQSLDMQSDSLLLHVTLMRLKKIIDANAFEEALNTTLPIGNVLPHIDLMQSKLLKDGAQHTLIKRLI